MKNMCKKAVGFVLTAALALAAGAAAFAEELPGEGQEAAPGYLAMYGTIIEEAENKIWVQDDLDDDNIIVLNLSEATVVVDAVTGMSTPFDGRETERVAVFYGPFMTRSMPPQSNAAAIAVNLPENQFSPHYVVAGTVTPSDGGGAKVLTDDGSLVITIDENTALLPYLTRNIVTAAQITDGSELLVWYDAVMLSYPGQTIAKIAVFIKAGETDDDAAVPSDAQTPAPETGDAAADIQTPDTGMITVEPLVTDSIIYTPAAGVATVNGKEVVLPPAFSTPATPMLPVRLISDALGYTVDWDQPTRTATLTGDRFTFKITLNSRLVYQNGVELTLDYVPAIQNDSTMWMPLSFFEGIMNAPVTVVDFE